MKNKTQFLLITLALLVGLNSIDGFSQPASTNPDPEMLSGPSTSYGISSVYSSNIFSGSVNVTIPIYKYSNNLGDFGISMVYNTKGVRVDEIENPEGLHWELLNACKIERIVKDIPDELSYNSGQDSISNGNRTFWNNCKMVKGKWATYWETPQEQAMTNVYRDGESDDFIVTINGSTFTFNLGRDLFAFTHPHRNVKVQPLVDGAPLYNVTNQTMGQGLWAQELGFQITDEQGNVYLFEQGDIPVKYIYDNTYWDDNVIVNTSPITRWNIKKITLADGKEINYDYEHSWTGGGSQSYTQLYKNHFVLEKSSGTPEYRGEKLESETYSFSQLQSINYPNGNTVKFIYDATAKTPSSRKRLNEIQIVSNIDAPKCIRYKLFQSKINNRSYLDSIVQYSCDNTFKEKYYSFEYNSVKLPARFNPGQDLFGYFNADSVATPVNGSGTSISIPKHHYSNPSLNYGLTKGYLPYYAQASLLSKVKNGYGGQVRFTYKNNSNDVTSPFVVPGGSSNENFVGLGTLGMDGVAIDSIIETERFRPQDSRISVYDYHNSGQLFTPGGYVHYPFHIDSTTGNWDEIMYQGLYLTVHQFVDGSNHGYSAVGIKKFNGTGELLSRTEMTFTNVSDALSSSRFFKVAGSKELYEYPYSDKQYLKDWEIGLPLEITEYDNNNRIVTKTINEYSFSPVDLSASSWITNTRTKKVNIGTSVSIIGGTVPKYYPNKVVFSDTYFPYTGKALLSKVTVNKYTADTRFVTDVVEYYYDSKNNPTSIITKNSKGEKIATNFIFNYAVNGPESSYPPQPNTTLYNMSSVGLEKIVSIERWKIGSEPAPWNNTLLDASITRYAFTPGKVWEKSLYNLAINAPLAYSTYTGMTTGGTATNPYSKILLAFNTQDPVPFYNKSYDISKFDDKGNALEIQYLDNGKFTAAIIDTTIKKTVAEAANAKFNEIAYTSFENVGVPNSWLTQGNFELNTLKVVDASIGSAVTGRYTYALAPPSGGLNFSDIHGTQDLTPGKQYLLSFWANGGIPIVKLGTSTITPPTQPTYQIGNWRYYTFKFSVSTAAKIWIAPLTTSTIYLDDIRLHPADAVMMTRTFIPLFGIGSSSDASGRVTYYDYDKLGRLNLVKDQEGNIIRKTKQYVAGGL